MRGRYVLLEDGGLKGVDAGLREGDVIDSLRRAFPESGLGDDAAVVPFEQQQLLFAADAVVEGVHFSRNLSTLSQAVQKLITSNVSDIFAMGGAPRSIVFTAGMPKGSTTEDIDGIIEGLGIGAKAYGLKLAGGDTVLNPGAFFFNVAVLGSVEWGRAVTRDGAREGDTLVLFGMCGASLAGLSLLGGTYGSSGGMEPLQGLGRLGADELERVRELSAGLTLTTGGGDIEAMCREQRLNGRLVAALKVAKRHLVPLARSLDASLLGADPPVLSAMIDISDGIGRDLRALCRESGVGAVVEEDSLPIPEELAKLSQSGRDDLTGIVLSSGEEYVLLAALRGVERDEVPEGGTVIGSVVPGGEGIALLGRDGRLRPFPESGYEHVF